jgi:hypothetical protein
MGIYRRSLRTFDAASLTGSLQNVGAIIPFATQKITFINTSDVDVLIADGTNEDNFRIPAMGTLSIGESLNNAAGVQTKFVLRENTQLQIVQVTAAGTGTIIIHCFG